MKALFADGKPVPAGRTIVPDHYEQEFTIKISSMTAISAEMLKNLIQNKYKVLEIEKTNAIVYPRYVMK